MKKIKDFLNNFEEYTCIVLLGIMAVVVFIQVIFRFVVKASLPWSEETSRYLLVWITFLGASAGVKTGAHVGVEAVTLMLPYKLRKMVNLLGIAICVFFSVAVCVFSLGIISTQVEMAQVSPAMQIPMWIPYLAIPVGMILMTIRYIQSTVKVFKELKAGGEDHGVTAGN